MNFFLFDNPNQSYDFIKISGEKVYSPKIKYKLLSWILGVIKVLFLSKKGDIVICWFDFQAVICYWLGLLFFKHRKIVCINIMLKNKRSLRNKIVTYLYKKALQSNYFYATVTSVDYGKQIIKRLGIQKDLFLLHDVYFDWYYFKFSDVYIPNSIFCGGRNGRDWQFMLKVAQRLPKYSFYFVMPKEIYYKININIPSNITIKYDLTYNEFMYELCKSELVCLPLDTEAPAGLIVMFQAAANMKYILTTDTCTTREYLFDNNGSLLPNDIEIWVKEIERKMNSKIDNKIKSERLLYFLQNNCSEKVYIKGLEEIISLIKKI